MMDVGRAAGSYAYTRFDNDPGDGNDNVASDALNMTDPAAKVVVEFIASDDTDVALLLRATDQWWQSSSKTFTGVGPATPEWTFSAPLSTVDFEFAGAGAVSWTQVTNATDIDQVDDGGEGALTLAGSPGTPDLSTVDGVGVIITSASGSTAGFTGITYTRIQLEAPPFPTAADEWTRFK